MINYCWATCTDVCPLAKRKKNEPKTLCLVSLQDGVLLGRLITKYCPVDGIDPSNLQVRSTFKYCMWFRDLFMLLFVKHI